MVTTSTPTSGCSRFIARVASRPSISGILTSMRTRSGVMERQSRKASRPFCASPTTSKSGSPSSMLRSPSRTRSWSSAMRRRVLVGPGGSPKPPDSAPIGANPRRLPQRNLGDYQGAGAGTARDPKVPAEQRYPLAHAGETYPFSGTGRLRRRVRRETLPVVSYGEPDYFARAVEVLQREVYPPGAGVLDGVGEGFLRNPEERRFHGDRQPLVVEVAFVADLPPFGAQGLELEADRRFEPEVV